MKKILLVLFLVLGVVSFSALRLDTNKLQKKNYEITNQDEQIITLSKAGQGYVISPFYMSEIVGDSAKDISKMTIETAPESQKILSSYETGRAYIVKFKDTQNGAFSYTIVGKKQKVKGWYTGIIFIVNDELSKTELNKMADTLLNEAESLIK